MRSISRPEFFATRAIVSGEGLVTATPKLEIPGAPPHFTLYPNDIRYFLSFDLVECAPKRFETLSANSSEANLLLNSATSAAKM